MSDTCWLRLRFARRHLRKVNQVLSHHLYDGVFWDEEDGDEQEVSALLYDANYGWYDELRAISKALVPFIASHGEGGEYGAAVSASYAGIFIECDADHEGYPIARIDENGNPDIQQTEKVINYYRLEKLVESDIKGGSVHKSGGENGK